MFDILRTEFYGASHEDVMGAAVYGLETGTVFSMKKILEILERRSPAGISETVRREKDNPEFTEGVSISGDAITVTGDRVEFIIKNKDFRDRDYDKLKDIPRPSHADYAAYMKYGNIPSGGGKFSGRMTALMCIIGSLASQILEKEGITIKGEAKIDESLLDPDDSIGGIVETTVSGVKAGALGDALFDGLEGKIAYSVFGVPAVKGVEFGAGFALAKMKGSEANDTMHFDSGKVVYDSDNMGGIDGGISNGSDIILRAVVKPASSIKKEQKGINLKTKENITFKIEGRHDSCIVRRAVPCVESAVAIAILDELYKQKKNIKY